MLGSTPLPAQEADAPGVPSSQYSADAALFSYQPGQEIATYSSYGSGEGGPGSTLGLGVASTNRQFDVRVVGELKEQKFLVTIKITPGQSDTQTHAQETKFDLSDLSPRSLEIGHDADGRVYKLNIVPRIVEMQAPIQFKASNFRLESWSFPASPVILNDRDYIGEMGMTGGSLAWCDIPGLARIEFSLLHLKDALPIGTLSNGVLTITHESGNTLRISNVMNGTLEAALQGGPYIVWVRWNKPSMSVPEFQAAMKAQLTMVKEKVKNGDMTLPPGSLERLEKMCESGRFGLLSAGVQDVKPDDLVEPAQ
jgi:hypothetical protein